MHILCTAKADLKKNVSTPQMHKRFADRSPAGVPAAYRPPHAPPLTTRSGYFSSKGAIGPFGLFGCRTEEK